MKGVLVWITRTTDVITVPGSSGGLSGMVNYMDTLTFVLGFLRNIYDLDLHYHVPMY